jgi:hypothetical protein
MAALWQKMLKMTSSGPLPVIESDLKSGQL